MQLKYVFVAILVKSVAFASNLMHRFWNFKKLSRKINVNIFGIIIPVKLVKHSETSQEKVYR